VYVGASVDIGGRWAQHRRDLRLARHPKYDLQRAWDAGTLSFAILEQTQRDELRVAEQRWIASFRDQGAAVQNRTRRDWYSDGLGQGDPARLPMYDRPWTDPQNLRMALGMHAAEGPLIDMCWGRGRMWKDLERAYRPVRCDADGTLPGLDIVAAWRDLPAFCGRGRIFTAVADPPHLSHLGDSSLLRHFGTTGQSDVMALIGEVLDAARLMLHPEFGTLILKVGDQVHDDVRKWQWLRTLELARAQGWNICDLRVIDSAAIPVPQARRRGHYRSQVAWIVLHPASKCPGDGIPLPGRTRCACGCNAVMTTGQVRAKNYLPNHRQRAYRRRKQNERIND
jgi:hypothetical protein